MIFRKLPVIDRLKRITELGFMAEIWDWTKHDIDVLAKSGARFSSMTGYVTGTLADDAGADELLRTAKQSIPIAKKISCPRLNLHGTGLDGQGLPVVKSEVVTGAMWLKAHDTLNRVCDLGEELGVVFTLENLNWLDHPGCPFGATADVLTLVSSVNRPELRINLDLYHTQIGEGDLLRWCEKCLPFIGEVQVADNPGRCEPGTGEINYPGVARALKAMGYAGPVGLESFAMGDEEAALEAFRKAFTV